jgi:hypothetical protein
MCYLGILGNLLPQDPTLLRPTLAHPDFHTANICVDLDNPSEVTSILDWSSTEIAPLLVQARPLRMIDHEGPQLQGLERPKLPGDLAMRSDEERHLLRIIHLQQTLVALYRTLIHKRSPDLWACFEYQDTPQFELLTVARRLLHEGEAPYLASVLELLEAGSSIVTPSAASDGVSQARRAALLTHKCSIMKYADAALAGSDVMEQIQQTLGDLFPEQGVVRHDQYDETKRALGQIKKKVIEEFARSEEDKVAWHHSWPSDD